MIKIDDVFYQQNKEDRLSTPKDHRYLEWNVVFIVKNIYTNNKITYTVILSRNTWFNKNTTLNHDLEYELGNLNTDILIDSKNSRISVYKDKLLLKDAIIKLRNSEIREKEIKLKELTKELEELKNTKV